MVIRVHLLGAMGLAVLKMDAEMAVEAVGDGGGAVGHTVHGRGVHMSVVKDKDGAPPPAPMNRRKCSSWPLYPRWCAAPRQDVAAGPADGLEGLAGLYILDGKARVFWE